MTDYDLVVVGGGTAGLSAARAGTRRGARTLLVQRGPLGGDCTFTGCVPSKTLIESAARGEPFGAAMAAVRRAVHTVAATEDDDVLRREGVDVIHGWATFCSPRAIDIDGRRIACNRFIIATGAGPAVPPIEGLDAIDYLTNENVFELETLPSSMAVLGGGAVGCELAQAFARFGSSISVIERLPRILPQEEPEASETIADAFAAEDIDLHVGHQVTRVEAIEHKGAARLHLGAGDPVTTQRVLVAVGREPATDGLGLDAAGVQTERGFIATDDTLATTAKGIWAVGDVAGRLQFTHAADEMGRVAAANALSRLPRRKFRASWIPRVTFTDPEVGRVGASEADAAAGGGRVAFLPMSEVDRAVAASSTRGFIKLIAGARPVLRGVGGGQILGATVVAPRGGELIHEPTLAMRTRMFTGRLAQTVHAYPTWSVAVQQVAAQFFMEIGGRRARPARPADTAGVQTAEFDR